MLTTAVPCDAPLTTLTALMLTSPVAGTVAGAVYRPALVMVPRLGSPPTVWLTAQVTP